MACLGVTLKNDLINFLLRGQALNYGGNATGHATASLWIGLFTTNPLGGTGGVEVTGSGYGRAEIVSGTGNWAAPVNGLTSNTAPVVFPSPTGDWGSVIGCGAWSAATGGTLLLYGPVDPAKTIISGDPAPVYALGALTLTLDAC